MTLSPNTVTALTNTFVLSRVSSACQTFESISKYSVRFFSTNSGCCGSLCAEDEALCEDEEDEAEDDEDAEDDEEDEEDAEDGAEDEDEEGGSAWVF